MERINLKKFFLENKSKEFVLERVFRSYELDLDNFRHEFGVDIFAKIKKTRDNIYELNLKSSFVLPLSCDNCLKDVDISFSKEYSLKLIVLNQNLIGHSISLSEEDFYTYYIDDESFDLIEIIRDTVMEAVPIKTVCSEDCKPFIKEDKQKDSRFDILKTLLIKEVN